jgi:hypothetical protein
MAYKDLNGNWTIIGVASSTMGPDYPELPAIYTRVASFLEWIDNTTMAGLFYFYSLHWFKSNFSHFIISFSKAAQR